MYEYLLFLLLLIPCLIFSGWASARVSRTFTAYDRVQTRSCMTGYDTAVRLMSRRGVHDISVNRVDGKLTDHYHPTKKQVNLSMSSYGESTRVKISLNKELATDPHGLRIKSLSMVLLPQLDSNSSRLTFFPASCKSLRLFT